MLNTLEICMIELETNCQKSASLVVPTEGGEEQKEIEVVMSETRERVVTRTIRVG
jgi:hypothetical protein